MARAISNDSPPVTVGTLCTDAAATFRRVTPSSVIIQQPIDSLRSSIRCALWSRWASSENGSQPESTAAVHGGRSGTPMRRKNSVVVECPRFRGPFIGHIPSFCIRGGSVLFSSQAYLRGVEFNRHGPLQHSHRE